MVKLKKRCKNRRYRGSKGCGGGFRQKRRGKGNTGGKGMSGTGKRSNQKMGMGQMIARAAGFEKYFGRRGYTSAPTARKINKVMNLDDIFKLHGEEKEINLEGYKILGEGRGFKAVIKADSASASAVEKMEKAGGKIIVKEIKSKEESAESGEKVEKKAELKKEVKKAADKKSSK